MKGWLVICFLGEPTAGRGELPRVAVWSSSGPPELVSLSPGPRRLLAQLSIPPLRFGVGLSDKGISDALAGELAKPLPRRSTESLQRALQLSRTTEYRYRRQLLRELTIQGLDDHLEVGRGWLEPNRTMTDIAMLVRLVRDADDEGARRLLTIVGRGDPHRVQWMLTDHWPTQSQASVVEALALAKQRLATRRAAGALVPAPVDSDTGATGTGIALPWSVRAVDRGPVRRRRMALAALCALAVATGAALGTWLPPSQPDDGLGLKWPYDGSRRQTHVANLSKELGLSAGVPATEGDELLLRRRVPAALEPRRRLEVQGNLSASDGRETWASLVVDGQSNEPETPVAVRTGSPALRLYWIPGSAVLRSAGGALVRRLPDISDGRRVPLPALKPGRAYFVDARLAVLHVTRDDLGQVAVAPVTCHDPHGKPGLATQEVRFGERMTCEAKLVNWGPRTLDTVYASFVPGDVERKYVTLAVVTDSTLASPRFTWLDDFKRVQRGTDAAARLVRGSLRTIAGEGLAPRRPEGSFARGVDIGELAPGRDNAVVLRFQVVVD